MAAWAKEIETAARDRMREDGGTYYDDSQAPAIEIISESPSEVTFIAHRYVYNFAQSGSDWADHYILRGRARLDGNHVGDLALEPHHVHLTELEHDDYRQADVIKLLADNMVTEARDAVATMKATTEAKITVARARQSAPEAARIKGRCPTCRAADVEIVDILFDDIQMRCRACGFEDTIDNWNREWDP